MQEHKALGMVGKVELPAGFGKSEGETKWNSFYCDAMLSAVNPYRSLTPQCRPSVQYYNSQGLIDRVPLVALLVIMFKENPPGTSKQHENTEFSSSFTRTYIRQVPDSEELLQLGYLANTSRIGGANQPTDCRINIGG